MEQQERLMVQVATRLAWGQTAGEIHDYLIAEGLSESDAYLTFQAGRLLLRAEAAE